MPEACLQKLCGGQWEVRGIGVSISFTDRVLPIRLLPYQYERLSYRVAYIMDGKGELDRSVCPLESLPSRRGVTPHFVVEEAPVSKLVKALKRKNMVMCPDGTRN
jgi:hypothetical protein